MGEQPGKNLSQATKDYNVTPELEGYIKTILEEKLANYAFNSGIGGQERQENKPFFKLLPNETMVAGKTNTFIILGADRNAGPLSGKGGKGNTGAACIDLISGLSGEEPIQIINNETQETSKSFAKDAARVYISQKSNIDEYIGIPKLKFLINGNTKISTEDYVNKSSVAIISDCSRIVGRNTVKIVTFHHGQDSTKNNIEQNGIDIIAGVDSLSATTSPLPIYDLQPMVKGNNLVLFLKRLIKEISFLHNSVRQIELLQNEINMTIANHKHQAGPYVSEAPLNENLIKANSTDLLKQSTIDAQKFEVKLGLAQNEYFNPGKSFCILSNFNRVN